MSRRKQAKPRALKRDLSDTEDEVTTVTMETEKMSSEESLPDDTKDISLPFTETMDTNQVEEENINSDIAITTVEDEVEEEEYRCETCNATFLSLLQFMDHRNFDCLSGETWLKSNSASPSASRSSSPYSLEAGKSPNLPQGSPYSPTSSMLALDQIPFSIGVNENNPYPCQFCEKAFSRLSYLKRHEQVHSDQMPFKCDYCSRLFKHKRSRDRHVKLHTGDKKYKCMHCESAFSRSDHLKIHMKTHDNGKPFQCTTCNRGYTTAAALTSHMLTHKKTMPSSGGTVNKDFKCMHCMESFTGSSDLYDHMQLHESSLDHDKLLSCKYCGEYYISQVALDTHIEHEHSKDSSTMASIKCPLCDAYVLTPEELKQHMKLHSATHSSDESSQPACVANPALTVSPNSQTKHNCPYCSKSAFPSREVLEIHLHTMHGGKSLEYFSCQHCPVVCPSLYALQEHLKLEHKDIYGNQNSESGLIHCNYCTMEFTSSEALQSHKEKVHKFTDILSKSADYVLCTHCTMTFPSSLALGEHMHSIHGISLSQKSPLLLSSPVATATIENSHFGGGNNNKFLAKAKSPVNTAMLSPNSTLRPAGKQDWEKVNIKKECMTCDLCNATFYDSKLYQSHLKTHQTSTTASAVNKFSCTECSAEFSSEDQLESHVFVHFLALTTEYGCTSCLKLFSKPDELQKHLMDIHAHHLYRCSLCKEIFDSKVNVQVHFAIKHSNECKLYKCTSCSSVFRSEMEWQLHVKVNHLGISKPYRCLFCKESFGSEIELQCHLTTHKKAFPCPLCEEAFHVEYLLDKHMQSAHCQLEGNQSTTKIKHEKEADVIDYTTGSAKKDESNFVISNHNHSNNKLNINHQQISASPNQEKQYRCELGDARFSDDQTLQKHKGFEHNAKSEMTKSPTKLPEFSPKVSSTPTAASSSSQATPSEKFGQLCVYCNQSFKTKGELEKHMKTHVSPSNQKCNICDEIFPSASILAEHKLMHCKVVQGNMCVVCKVALKNEDAFYTHAQQHGFQGAHMQCIVCRQTLASMLELQMHGKHHFQNPTAFFTCCVCLKSYDSKENLVSKLNSSGRSYYVCKPCYHGEVVTEIICQQCGLKFDNQSQLEAHMVEHKKTYQCIKCQQSFCSEYEIQAHVAEHMMQEGNVHECKLCKTSFESPAKLQCHLIEHTFADSDFQCYVCTARFSHSSTIQMHALEHGIGARRYTCSQCPQKFFFSAELENHLYSHGVQSTSSEYQCPDCNKVFASIANLTNHRKIHDDNTKSLKCSLCVDVFSSMTQLQQHFFSVHSDADAGGHRQTFSCTQCDMEFPCLSNLQGHMRIHNSGTKYSCKECGKDFALVRNLNIHMRSHSGEKPYECPICHKRFARKENRKAHLKSHSGLKPYMCPVCGKSFSRKSHVKDHLRVHVNQMPHTCQICSETFQQTKHLRRHLVLVHNKNLENACQICNESFSMAKNLKRHMIRVHKIDNMDSPVDSPDSVLTDNDCDNDTSDSFSLASDSSTTANGVDVMDTTLDDEELSLLRQAEVRLNGDHIDNGLSMDTENGETNSMIV